MNSTLNAMNSTTQGYQDYQTFLGIMANLKGNGLTVYDIDSTQQLQLQNLASSGLGRVNIYARNILKWLGHLDYSEILLIPDGSPKSEPIAQIGNTEHVESSNFKVYPNPTRNYVILDWEIIDFTNKMEVRINSTTGECIMVVELNQPKGQKVINLTNIPVGAYLITLYNKQKIEASKKLIVR